MSQEPHVMILGLRGFPDIQGGVEVHAEHLFPLIASQGFRVTVIARSSRLHADHPKEWHGVHFVRLWAPRSRGLETLVHTLLGVLYAAAVKPDVLHLQAIGPALWTPLARLLGLRVVVTHHGPDYDRQKWGRLARLVLRCGEYLGMRFAHRRIAISECIRHLVDEKYGLDAVLIPNGVDPPNIPSTAGALKTFELSSRHYVLMVSRLVPEKRHEDLIRAFEKAGLPGWKLVLVGGADHPDAYSRKIEYLAAHTPNVVATGVLTGLALSELYANAGLFVLPSSHEGLPIALLEALSYGLQSLSTRIPAHLEVGLPSEQYFPPGDVTELSDRLRRFAQAPCSEEIRRRNRERVVVRYNWGEIARETAKVYRSMLN